MPTPTSDRPPSGDGLLIVDKPAEWTSHDVVARSRRLAATRKVGHAGTLDPMATGVLILGINRGTKLLTFLVGCDKDYEATIRLGQSTLTDDADAEVLIETDAAALSDEQIRAAVAGLTGDIMQVPSSVSAIKIDGKRSYARVRTGEQVELAARPITVSAFEVTDIRRTGTLIDIDVKVTVSSGTYVRALARDLGEALGVGGHLTALRRTRVGRFGLDEAHDLAGLADAVEAGTPLPLIPLGQAAAQFPTRVLSRAEVDDVRHGRRIESDGQALDPVAALDENGELVAMLDQTGKRPRSHVVFTR